MANWFANLLGKVFGAASKPAPPKGDDRPPVRGRYDAAQTTEENARLWTLTDALSARGSNTREVRKRLRERSRYEVANNSYARGIVETLANDLVGRGPRARVRLGSPATNRQVQQAWSRWSLARMLPDKLRLMGKAKVQDGEGIGVQVTNARQPVDGVQLDLAVIESDQVTNPRATYRLSDWVDGLVLDDAGNVVSYDVLKYHPGDLFLPFNPAAYETVPARLVHHWFRRDRPGQARGIPEITSALELFGMLRRFTRATLSSAETAANFAGVLETQAPADTQVEQPPAWDVLEVERGSLLTLPWQTKLNQFKAEHPSTTYEMFVKLLLREIARCLGMPWNKAACDSSSYNFSSAKLDHLDYYRSIRVQRQLCEAVVLTPLFMAWLAEAVLIPGLLPPGIVPALVAVEWFWDGDEIDPVAEAQADQVRLATRTRTYDDIFAARGEDWEEQFEQMGREQQAMTALGIMPATLPGQAPAGDAPPARAAASLLEVALCGN